MKSGFWNGFLLILGPPYSYTYNDSYNPPPSPLPPNAYNILNGQMAPNFNETNHHYFLECPKYTDIMFTPARDFLLETPWRIIIPNPNVNSHSL
jgi:hypothetical protein